VIWAPGTISERVAAAVELIMEMTNLCGTLLVLIEGEFAA
jgi:hypothetical protein